VACGVLMFERTLNIEINEAYRKLKGAFTEKGCKVISEEAPSKICFKQGSLWGIAPQTAKKTIAATLEPTEVGTRVKFSSLLSSDWKNITLVGCAFAFVLVGVCVWMATDLNAFITTRNPTFWSELISNGDTVNLTAAHSLINLTWGLTVFLSIVILLEAAIVVYARSKIDLFTKETLNQLS